jgi:hypothetical protein
MTPAGCATFTRISLGKARTLAPAVAPLYSICGVYSKQQEDSQMTTRMAVNRCESINYLKASLRKSATDDTVFAYEVYSGSINMSIHSHGPIFREQYSILIPMRDAHIRLYEGGGELQVVPMVALGAFSGEDDEENLAAVDDFGVLLEPQSIPGVSGSPPCLVLYFRVALQNGNLYRVSYHVSVTFKPGSKFDDIDIPPDTVPAP